jgi:hypothetical protein
MKGARESYKNSYAQTAAPLYKTQTAVKGWFGLIFRDFAILELQAWVGRPIAHE